MASAQEYRLYSFVANLYLSPLQQGLQTAHVVSELSEAFQRNTPHHKAYSTWAQEDKTIIICGASHHGGVLACWEQLKALGLDQLDLPVTYFREDEVSMNNMVTACGVIVPKKYWDTTFVPFRNAQGQIDREDPRGYWKYVSEDLDLPAIEHYSLETVEGQFINHIKGYRLA